MDWQPVLMNFTRVHMAARVRWSGWVFLWPWGDPFGWLSPCGPIRGPVILRYGQGAEPGEHGRI